MHGLQLRSSLQASLTVDLLMHYSCFYTKIYKLTANEAFMSFIKKLVHFDEPSRYTRNPLKKYKTGLKLNLHIESCVTFFMQNNL